MVAFGAKRMLLCLPAHKIGGLWQHVYARATAGSRLGSSSLSTLLWFWHTLWRQLNPNEMTIQNGSKPTQSLLPVEAPTRGEHKAAPRHGIAAIIQPPRRVATKLRTLQTPSGKRRQRRCGHARGVLAARGTFHSADQRCDSHPGRALTAFCWFNTGHDINIDLLTLVRD